jgi:hypothetical protein
MLGVLWFLGPIVVSMAFGFAIHWVLTNDIPRRWIRSAVSILPGLFVLFWAGVYLTVFQPAPAIDDPRFTGGEVLGISYLSTFGESIKLVVAYPENMGVNHDFTIYIRYFQYLL